MSQSEATILIIDDDPEIRQLVDLGLSRHGFQVVAAASGTEGLIRAEREQPACILLDIMMREMDGWETLRLLRLDDETRAIPVVILSARSETRDRIRALQEGAADYLTKPFSVRDVAKRLRAVIAMPNIPNPRGDEP